MGCGFRALGIRPRTCTSTVTAARFGHSIGDVNLSTQPLSLSDLEVWRERYREETKGQIVHDSLHRRAGWTSSHQLRVGSTFAGYGSMAIAGPWSGKPTIYEFYVVPDYRTQAFSLFETYLAASGAREFEVQTNDSLLTIMLHAYGRGIVSEKIVFEDKVSTSISMKGAMIRRETSDDADRACIAQRQGGTKWRLEMEGAVVATGGINFHYNPPYGDIYMEVAEGFRRRGLGAFFVQELKRITYELGQIPCARCNTTNIASRQTIQRAGFAPCGHILLGSVAES
jgi:GNAT superfamily N-acetyltransferase